MKLSLMIDISAIGPKESSVKFESAAYPQVIPPDQYRKLMRGLNSKQRVMIMYHHN